MTDMFNHFDTTQAMGLCFPGTSDATKPPALFHQKNSESETYKI